MLPENRAYFIRGDDGLDYGPASRDELREWVRENRAGLGTEVRLDALGAPWQPWQDYPELVALLAEAQVAGPLPGGIGLVIAPMGRRIAAFALDLLLIMILLIPIFYIALLAFFPDWLAQCLVVMSQASFSPPEVPSRVNFAANLIFDCVPTLYFAGFLAAHGQTPGKALMRLRVVEPSGKKPGLARALLRGLVLTFSINLFCLPFLYAFFNPQRRALHDFIAGTCVIEA